MTRPFSHGQRIEYNAKCFLIWREATAVDWKCSPAELARATGVPRATVHDILRKRNWRNRLDYSEEKRDELSRRSEIMAIQCGLNLPLYRHEYDESPLT